MRCALIGNPNVGKSLIFSQLTGLGVEVSNYPGTTVEMESGGLCYRGEIIEITDLPGTYSLEGSSDEERTVREVLQEESVDVGIVVMDARHLERNLYLFLQVVEYDIPLVGVLNMMDEADAQGVEIDMDALRNLLGVEILPTAAILGKNVNRIVPLARSATRPATLKVPYAQAIEAAIRSLQKTAGASRRESLLALQDLGGNRSLASLAAPLREEIERTTTMTISQIIAANRHNFAQRIVGAAVRVRGTTAPFDPDRLFTRPLSGIPILVATLLGVLMGVFLLGSVLEAWIVQMFDLYLIAPLGQSGLPPLLLTVGNSLAIALQAGIGIALPYIFLFFIVIAVLEDTGYISRAAFLSDSLMHRIGLHGGAIVPLIFGLGCSVPAVMTTRSLRNKRERIIASFLTTLVPCSARTMIIMGLVATFVGILPALSLYLIIVLLIMVTGTLLSRMLPGEQYGMITEMPSLRVPRPTLVLQKSWNRLREFLFIAIPLLAAGSIVLGLLEFYGAIQWFQDVVSPFSVGVLGLPAFALGALVFGIMRKEMALGTLAVLAGTAQLSLVLSPLQLYTFALVSILFIPCISTIAVLYRVIGPRYTAEITLYTLGLGVILGGLINFLV
ncbi:MAG: ferrous iron transport protein B [Methanomicrobiales archaeon]|nr:ferrous iron transport protein B [Methanomicrobiales archaeon]